MSGSPLTNAAIPLRRRGWSSAARIRITLGTLPIIRRPRGTARIDVRPALFHMLSLLGVATRLLCPLPLPSKTPLVSRFASHVRESLVVPNGQSTRQRQGSWDRYPCRYRGYVAEAHPYRSESLLQGAWRRHGGKHFGSLHKRSDRPRPAGALGSSGAYPRPSHGRLGGVRSRLPRPPVPGPQHSTIPADHAGRPDRGVGR